MKLCSKCGTKNKDENRFCKKCGAELPLKGKLKKQEIIAAVIGISVILFISLLCIYHPREPARIYQSGPIITDGNISVWQDEACMDPLDFSEEEIRNSREMNIVFYIRNDRQHAVVATWEDNIYGDLQNVMGNWDEKNRTWWLWPEYVSEGPNYGLYLKSREVAKVRYEIGCFIPLRISIWSMKYQEYEE
jgi:hypothetical protein